MQSIVIEGCPIAQARVRLGRRGFVYDPNARDKHIIKAYLKQNNDYGLYNNPKISFLFVMPIPPSTSKKNKDLYEVSYSKHSKKPDIDNLVKLYLDCMDGIFFEGDQKVSLGYCVKIYGVDPKTIIYIEETPEQLTPAEISILGLESDKSAFC